MATVLIAQPLFPGNHRHMPRIGEDNLQLDIGGGEELVGAGIGLIGNRCLADGGACTEVPAIRLPRRCLVQGDLTESPSRA